MRRLQILAIGLLLGGCASTVRAQAASQGPAKTDVAAHQRAYLQYLKDEGYSPSVNSDGNVEFKYEGARFVILIDKDDRYFFQLVLPGIWGTEGEELQRKALAAANRASMTTKVAKVIVGKVSAYASFDTLLRDPSDVSFFLPRALGALRLAVKTFADEMGRK